EGDQPVVDIAGIAVRARDGDGLAILELAGGVAGADHGGNTELAGDDRRVAGAAAAVGDDRGGDFHDRLPVRVGHVGDENVALLHLRHLRSVGDDAHVAAADLVADRPAADEDARAALEREALLHLALLRLHRLRPRLQDVDAAVVAVPAPLDVHRPAV